MENAGEFVWRQAQVVLFAGLAMEMAIASPEPVAKLKEIEAHIVDLIFGMPYGDIESEVGELVRQGVLSSVETVFAAAQRNLAKRSS